MQRELELRAYRLVARFSLLLSLAAVVFGLYELLSRQWGLGLMGVGVGVLLLVPSQYFRIRPDPAAENLLVLVTRENCSLCDEARVAIRAAAQGTPFTVQEFDVRDHRHLRRFKNHVPVLFWQGDELGRLRIEAEAVRQRLMDVLRERELRSEAAGPAAT